MSRRRKTKVKAQALKQHHEENPFEDFDGPIAELYLLKSLHWIKHNLRLVVILAAVALVIAITAIIWLAWMETREDKSMLAFEKIIKDHVSTQGLSSSQLALSDLQKYSQYHNTHGTKIRAALLEADFLSRTEKNKAAAQKYSYLAQEMDEPYLKSFFQIQAAFLYEKAGESDSALQSYQKAAQNAGTIEIITAHARYGELRMLLEKSRQSDARKVLEELLKIKSDRDDIKAMQKQALALLLQKNLK